MNDVQKVNNKCIDIFHIAEDINGNNCEQNSFFHYTSLTGFKLMFEDFFVNGNPINLIASNLRYLNDEKELIEGEEHLKKYLEKHSNHKTKMDDNIFISCFCGKNDLLTQWLYYGKNSGISIEFKLKKFYFSWGNIENDDSLVAVSPIHVAYDPETIEKYFDIGDKYNALELIVPMCKNNSFKHEDESRLIFYPYENSKYNYREKNGILVPYIKTKMFPIDENHKAIKDFVGINLSNYIASFTIGPGENQSLIFNALIHMVEKGKVQSFFTKEDIKRIEKPLFLDDDRMITYKTQCGIEIKLSKIPFRG